MTNKSDAVVFSRYISDFLDDYAPNHITESECTVKSYKIAITLYMEFLGMMGVTPSRFQKIHFEVPFIEKWIRWLKEERGCSLATGNVRLASFRVFLKYVGERDVKFLYLYLDAKQIKRQKCVRNKISGLTRDAVEALLSMPDPSTDTGRRDLVLMTLLYSTAARIDEILSAKIKQLHIVNKKSYITIVGKGQKIRPFHLLPRAVAHISKYIREVHGEKPDPEAYVFYSRTGGVYTKMTTPAIDKRLKMYAAEAHKLCKDVPLNLHAHQFRHAKASHLIEDGFNILQVSALLGHENLETTMVYLDISTDEKAKAMATLESENDRTISKKWKIPDGSLTEFMGLKGKKR